MMRFIKNFVSGNGIRGFIAAAALSAVPTLAMAGHGDYGRDDRGGFRVGIDVPVQLNMPGRFHDDDDRPRFEQRQARLWVEPVYRVVSNRQWVEPVYQIVCDKVWVAPIVQSQCVRVWVPDRYETRDVTATDDWGHRRSYRERVLVQPAHYEDQKTDVVVTAGHYEEVKRQQLVCDGHWQTVDRQELVCAGHWETREIREVADRHDERPELRFELRLPIR